MLLNLRIIILSKPNASFEYRVFDYAINDPPNVKDIRGHMRKFWPRMAFGDLLACGQINDILGGPFDNYSVDLMASKIFPCQVPTLRIWPDLWGHRLTYDPQIGSMAFSHRAQSGAERLGVYWTPTHTQARCYKGRMHQGRSRGSASDPGGRVPATIII